MWVSICVEKKYQSINHKNNDKYFSGREIAVSLWNKNNSNTIGAVSLSEKHVMRTTLSENSVWQGIRLKIYKFTSEEKCEVEMKSQQWTGKKVKSFYINFFIFIKKQKKRKEENYTNIQLRLCTYRATATKNDSGKKLIIHQVLVSEFFYFSQLLNQWRSYYAYQFDDKSKLK